ncbi:hypothetical protein EDC39_1111, partial [Geothermobacter ehrlichii]
MLSVKLFNLTTIAYFGAMVIFISYLVTRSRT